MERNENMGKKAAKKPEQQTGSVTGDYSRLLKKLKNGDTAAFETIYMQWHGPIYHLLQRLTGSEAEAEDIAQDVFITLWETRSRIDTSKDIRTYIYLLARQSAYKVLRKSKAAGNYIADSAFDFDAYTDSHDIVVAKETALLTEFAIRTMPPQRREVYLLSYREGLSPGEISERLHIPPQRVSDHLYQARKYIKELIAFCLLFFV